MRLRPYWLLALVLSGCAHPTPPPPPNPIYATHQEAFTVRDDTGAGLSNVYGVLKADSGETFIGYSNLDGRLIFTVDKPVTGGATIVAALQEYNPFLGRVVFCVQTCSHPEIPLRKAHVDPSGIPLDQLAAVRGAMWTTRWDGGLGPRPGQPTNIMALHYLRCFGQEDQKRMLAAYKARGYTHAVATFSPEASNGYHDQWCTFDDLHNIDGLLDMLQLYWDNGIIPVVFIHPDNWTFEQTKALTPLFVSERAQRLMRIIVPSGWEPARYEWSSCTWAQYLKWGRETWPNALIFAHSVQDVDALTGVDELCDDNQNPNGKVDSWARVLPYMHGWLTQLGFYPDEAGAKERFADMFSLSNRSGYTYRFHTGGWPSFSAWGNVPVKVYAGEYAAYGSYWLDYPEATARAWGDAAVAAGADGYLDGGTIAVPVQ